MATALTISPWALARAAPGNRNCAGLRGGPGRTEKLSGGDPASGYLNLITSRIRPSDAFGESDEWRTLCLNDPDRALRRQNAAAERGEWPKNYWEQLLWSQHAYADSDTEPTIAKRLLDRPDENFAAISTAASSWISGHGKTLPDAHAVPPVHQRPPGVPRSCAAIVRARAVRAYATVSWRQRRSRKLSLH
jgi:hypothetical protein